MNAKTLIQRKFRDRWSDLQLLILLHLGQCQMVAYMELVREAGGSETGVWNALVTLRRLGAVDTFEVAGRSMYHLTVEGRTAISRIMSDEKPKAQSK